MIGVRAGLHRGARVGRHWHYDTSEYALSRLGNDGSCGVQGRTFGPLSFRLEAPAVRRSSMCSYAAVYACMGDRLRFDCAAARVCARAVRSPRPVRIVCAGRRSAGLRAIAERAIADNERALARRGVDRVPTRPFALDSCGAFDEGIAREFCEARLLAARSMRLALLLGLYPGEGAAAPVDRMPAPPLRIIPTDGALPLGERSE